MGSKKITKCLLAVYIIALIFIILFKMQLPFQSMPHIRNINLIPFGASVIINGSIDFDEIITNFIAFIPFGIFTGMLSEKKSVLAKTAPAFLTSLLLETAQFVFAIGASDITDLLMNTLGGMAGTGCYMVLSKIFGNKTNKILNMICMLGGGMLLLLVGILIAVNL